MYYYKEYPIFHNRNQLKDYYILHENNKFNLRQSGTSPDQDPSSRHSLSGGPVSTRPVCSIILIITTAHLFYFYHSNKESPLIEHFTHFNLPAQPSQLVESGGAVSFIMRLARQEVKNWTFSLDWRLMDCRDILSGLLIRWTFLKCHRKIDDKWCTHQMDEVSLSLFAPRCSGDGATEPLICADDSGITIITIITCRAREQRADNFDG